MPLFIKQVLAHGTANPIVARLSVQTHQLLQFCSISTKERKRIFNILHGEVQRRLLTCDDIAKAVCSEIETVKNQIAEKGLHTQAQGRVFEVPYVLTLEERVEQYLYAAKSALRDIAKLFDPFFGEQFSAELDKDSKSNYKQIYKWCVQYFGREDNLSKLINEDQELWIEKLVKMRNAVEHPGGRSGHLYIHNFEAVFLTENHQPSLIEPTWHLNDEPRVLIGHDLPVGVSNILEFAEDLFVLLLRKAGLPEIVDVFQIPENKRNPECPVRLEVRLHEAKCLPKT